MGLYSSVLYLEIRKHSSTMHTARFSGSGGGSTQHPHTEADPLEADRQIDRCKNITLSQTSFAGVISTLMEILIAVENKNKIQHLIDIWGSGRIDIPKQDNRSCFS